MDLFRILFHFSSPMMPLYAFLMMEPLMIRAALNKSFDERKRFNRISHLLIWATSDVPEMVISLSIV